jgi:hypothetical protein
MQYCFEGNRKGEVLYDRAIAKFSLSGTSHECQIGIDEIYLTFYGGEPLLSKKLIKSIAGKVKALAKRRKIRFSFSLQTNGTLLTKKTVEELSLSPDGGFTWSDRLTTTTITDRLNRGRAVSPKQQRIFRTSATGGCQAERQLYEEEFQQVWLWIIILATGHAGCIRSSFSRSWQRKTLPIR